MPQWKEKIKESNLCDWKEEVERMSNLRWYRLQRMMEQRGYIKSLQVYE